MEKDEKKEKEEIRISEKRVHYEVKVENRCVDR